MTLGWHVFSIKEKEKVYDNNQPTVLTHALPSPEATSTANLVPDKNAIGKVENAPEAGADLAEIGRAHV